MVKIKNMSKEIAKEFWSNSSEYPNFGNIKKRRLCELNYLIPKLDNVNRLLDLGCGDGALLNCLIHLKDFSELYGYDFSENLLKNVHNSIKTKVFDCYDFDKSSLPNVDGVVCGGLVQYIFEDDTVRNVLSSLNTKKIYLRSACTLEKTPQLINTFSENLKKSYTSYYRPLNHLIDLVSEEFIIESVDRIYPDSIESSFGTKQFYIVGTKK
jgi:SAM-dependent methyltransferase